jgi:hypothetical protein
MKVFYTYAWLRENRTPYYVGKGKGKRAWRKGSPSADRVLILKKDLTEEEAFKHEIYMIAVLGRKENQTGILRNFTEGGQGTSGLPRPDSAERCQNMKGELNPMYGKTWTKSEDSILRGSDHPMYGSVRPDLTERNRLNPPRKGKGGGCWISKGSTVKYLKPGDPLPEGWEYGRGESGNGRLGWRKNAS